MEEGLTVPFICLNGAEVRKNNGELLSATYLAESDIDKIIMHFRRTVNRLSNIYR